LAGLNVYVSNRVEILAQKLAELLSTPLDSPLAKEVIVVQSKGMERWVRMELASHHGICANVRFPFPNAIIHEFFGAFRDLPEETPYEPTVMMWRIMGLLRSCIKMPGFEDIRYYFGDKLRGVKWFQLSERIAHIFDQYLIFRPGMILGWEEGKGASWEAVLWRHLVRGCGSLHRAALRRGFLDHINSGGKLSKDLPQRISIFGISTLPPYHIGLFAAVAQLIEVNMFLMNPCREYWADIVSDRELKRFMTLEGMEGGEPATLHLERGNSLLASMGHLGRDFFSMIAGLEYEVHECFQDIDPQDMLSYIHSDILYLRERGERSEEKILVSEDDRSIQVHSCHSSMREMEVLYDNLLALFEKDPDLMPKDVLIMTPDIEAYSPFIQAVFGVTEDEHNRIPFSVADRSLIAESPAAEAFLAILDLCDGRFRTSEVFSILECPLIQQRFDLMEADLPLIKRWVNETGIRWGIDAKFRERMGLPPGKENTWRFGLDRLLLGYAMPGKGERLFRGILPYDHVEGSDVPILGRFVSFVEGLFSYVSRMRGTRSLSEWSMTLTGLLDRFFLSDGQAEWEVQIIRNTLHGLKRLEELSGFDEMVNLEVVKEYLAGYLEKKGLGFGFITGGVTFCAMLPMRSIPFKVICLVGMNNDAFPRQTKSLGFDLMARHPRPGDRSRRKDDRYLFLEAILSARDTLYISYVGQSALDNSKIAPSVVVSELLDYIGQGFSGPGEDIMDNVVTRHRLQAFSPSYFRGRKRAFSYSQEDLNAARAALGSRNLPEPLISKGLTEPQMEWKVIDLEGLSRFFSNPAKFLLKGRLGIRLKTFSDRQEETEPFVLEGLERYQLEQGLVEKGLSGWDLGKFAPVVKASGQLPHGTIGDCVYESSRLGVEEFINSAGPWIRETPLETLELDLHLAGVNMIARVGKVYPDALVQYRYARLRAKDHLRLWLVHLLLNGFGPENYPRQSVLLGRDETWLYGPITGGQEVLERLLEIYLQGLRRPLHFFPESSLKYADALFGKGRSEEVAMRDAGNTWYGNDFSRGEASDDYFQACFRGSDPLDADFRALAIEVFAPILECRKRGKYSGR